MKLINTIDKFLLKTGMMNGTTFVSNEGREQLSGVYKSVSLQGNKNYKLSAEIKTDYKVFLWIYLKNKRKTLDKIFVELSNDYKPVHTYFKLDEPDDCYFGIMIYHLDNAVGNTFSFTSCNLYEVTMVDDVVDYSYVLNLEEEENKYEQTKYHLNCAGIKCNRFDAVRGIDEPHKSDWEKYKEEPLDDEEKLMGRKKIGSPGAWGYLLTMKNIFLDAKQKKYKRIAVFDDDVLPHKNFVELFSKFINSIEPDWKLIQLGASQWIFSDNIKYFNNYYQGDKLTNGSFASLYSHDVYDDILNEIEKMKAPFDSGACYVTKQKHLDKSYVCHPNLMIAYLEKTGINGKRSQDKFAERFKWNLPNYVSHIDNFGKSILKREIKNKINKKHIVIGVSTFNRLYYLEIFLETLQENMPNEYDYTVIITDDGTENMDSFIDSYIDRLKPGINFAYIRNTRRGIAVQSNSILKYASELDFDVGIKFDDDMIFESPQWVDLVMGAIKKSTFKHFVYYNKNWRYCTNPETIDESGILASYTTAENAYGCFWTFTKEIIEKVGYFDEKEFKVRGHSHIDYTMRCCRAGFNDINTIWTIRDLNNHIGMHLTNKYIDSTKNSEILYIQINIIDAAERERRLKIIRSDDRPNYCPCSRKIEKIE